MTTKKAVKKTKFTVQVSDNRGYLHFQVGTPENYDRSVNISPLPKKYSLKGLKTNGSLAGTSTQYAVIPAKAFTAKAAFTKKHGFSLGKVEKAVKAYAKAHNATL